MSKVCIRGGGGRRGTGEKKGRHNEACNGTYVQVRSNANACAAYQCLVQSGAVDHLHAELKDAIDESRSLAQVHIYTILSI